ncbi:hypothetical protein [Pedobacter frigoris]|uniref:hypothetical protein n=1 Tax=Pedobacter frigoris TaxID=2571272 RepID=UPI00292FC04A|nr:hypothetical protein [Pedobacter frigoris]
MNNTFSFSRFAKLSKRHAVAHYKPYLMSLLIMIATLFLFLGYASTTQNSFFGIEQYSVFMILLFTLGAIFTSGIFSEFSNPSKSISFLMLPGSSLEKWLVGWLYSFLIFLVVYIMAFYLTDVIVVNISNTFSKHPQKLMNLFDPELHFWRDLMMFTLIHSLSLFGALFFNKHHFLKIATLFVIFYIGLIFLNASFLNVFISKDISAGGLFSEISLNENKSYYAVQASDLIKSSLPYLLFVVTSLIWTAAYYKLKEKEV